MVASTEYIPRGKTATFRPDAALDLSLPGWIATIAYWIALSAWLVTAFGVAGSPIRGRGAAIHDAQTEAQPGGGPTAPSR